MTERTELNDKRIEQGENSCTTEDTFVPGSIHNPKNFAYWKDTLKANKWVLETLENGYALPFTTAPQQYEEPNNKSARDNIDFVRKEIRKLAIQGVVQVVKEKPHCVSPLTVAVKETSDGQIKKRLCWDGSRHINPILEEQKVKLSHLSIALEITMEGDYQMKYDLKSAFHHIKITEQHTKYLGAAYTEDNGKQVYIIFLYLPFGAASAVHCITKMLKPVIAHAAEQGIRHTIFIDDGRVVASSKAAVQKDFAYIISMLTQAGWQLSMSKTDQPEDASLRKEYLGFIIDTKQMRVFTTKEKKVAVATSIKELLNSCGKTSKLKQVAKVLGRMISLEPALGNFPLTFARLAYCELEAGVEKFGWKGFITVSAEALSSLGIFLKRFEEFNGTIIKTAAAAVSVLSIIGPPSEHLKTRTIPNHVRNLPTEIWCGDASNAAVCAYSIDTGTDTYFIGKLSPAECQLSSGGRELVTVLKALEAQSQATGPWKKSTLIYWLTDSTNLVTFLTKGSTKAAIQTMVIEVLCLAKTLNCIIQPIHLLRDDPRIVIADAGSKVPDSDDWSVDNATLEWLNEQLGPFTLDCFADESNKKVRRFLSNFACPTSLGIDALCHSWDKENCWICPPVSKVLAVFKKLMHTKGRGVLIIPKWPTANFWPILFPDGRNPSSAFDGTVEFNPKILQNQRARSVISGETSFPFLACYYHH